MTAATREGFVGTYAEDRMQLLDEWSSLEALAPPASPGQPSRLVRWIVEQTGHPHRKVDFARHVRNDCAHGKPVDSERLQEALRIVHAVRAALTHMARSSSPQSSQTSSDGATVRIVGPSSISGWIDVRCKVCGTLTAIPPSVWLSCAGCGSRLRV